MSTNERDPLAPKGEDPLAPKPDDPPVVARLVVEIRSDGTRTVARGAMEDLQAGERVALELSGASPAELAAQLLKSVAKLPFLAQTPGVVRRTLRALLPRGRKPE